MLAFAKICIIVHPRQFIKMFFLFSGLKRLSNLRDSQCFISGCSPRGSSFFFSLNIINFNRNRKSYEVTNLNGAQFKVKKKNERLKAKHTFIDSLPLKRSMYIASMWNIVYTTSMEIKALHNWFFRCLHRICFWHCSTLFGWNYASRTDSQRRKKKKDHRDGMWECPVVFRT